MSNYIGEPYDHTIRKTEHGARLYNAWRTIRRHPHCEEWEYFPAFYAWSMENGFTTGAWLRVIDKEKPYDEQNCVWCTEYKHYRAGDDSWVEDWNRAVNRIRRHYGMPPLEGTDYDDI